MITSADREWQFLTGYEDMRPTFTSAIPSPLQPTITTSSSASFRGETFWSETALNAFVGMTKLTVEAEWRSLSASSARDPAYERSRTLLGAELRRLRARIISSGQPQLTWEDIEKATAEMRGE